MLKFFTLLFVAVIFAFSAREPSVFDIENEPAKALNMDEIFKIAPTNEPDFDENSGKIYEIIAPNQIAINATNDKKSVYEFEPFSTTLNIDSGHDLSFDLNISIDAKDIVWLNQKPNWDEKKKKGEYKTTLFFLPSSAKASISEIKITLNRNGEFFQSKSFVPKIPTIKPLQKPKNFANLSANNLEVKKLKGAKFDKDKNIITLELNAQNAALNLFHIPQNFERQGVESIKGDITNQSGKFFVIAPNALKRLNFSYFNIAQNKFIDFDLAINIEYDDLSTQVNLNPKESEFEHYKKLTVYTLIIIFLLLFIFKKSYYCLVIGVFLIIYAFYINKPFSDATIKANTKITILPTKNSTIFDITNEPQSVKIITKKGEFTKILLENQNIGWVRNEDIE